MDYKGTTRHILLEIINPVKLYFYFICGECYVHYTEVLFKNTVTNNLIKLNNLKPFNFTKPHKNS